MVKIVRWLIISDEEMCFLFNPLPMPTATRTSSQVTFPVDFFEHNQQLTEVEFGGNDLLQVYNGQQIKHRLNSTGMYVANTKVGTLQHNQSKPMQEAIYEEFASHKPVSVHRSPAGSPWKRSTTTVRW